MPICFLLSTDYPKFNSLKQHRFIISCFVGPFIWICRTKIKILARLVFYWTLWFPVNPIPDLFRQSPGLCSCIPEIPISLLVINKGLFLIESPLSSRAFHDLFQQQWVWLFAQLQNSPPSVLLHLSGLPLFLSLLGLPRANVIAWPAWIMQSNLPGE